MNFRFVYKMHQDDLKAMWIYHTCKVIFIFHSDVDDHKHQTGHDLIEKVMMVSTSDTLAQE